MKKSMAKLQSGAPGGGGLVEPSTPAERLRKKKTKPNIRDVFKKDDGDGEEEGGKRDGEDGKDEKDG